MCYCFSDRFEEEAGIPKTRYRPEEIIGKLRETGVPICHVSKLLGHGDPATTTRHYADLAPGATKKKPAIVERYVSEAAAERNANRMRMAGSAGDAPKSGGA